MEIFKSDILKKEFKRFREEDLIKILACAYCQKATCQYFHTKSLVQCKFCRETFCKNCHKFNITKDILLEKVDEIGKNYIENFISKTIKSNYKV